MDQNENAASGKRARLASVVSGLKKRVGAALGVGVCETCDGAREIRRPYSAVERIPCPICDGETDDAWRKSLRGWLTQAPRAGVKEALSRAMRAE